MMIDTLPNPGIGKTTAKAALFAIVGASAAFTLFVLMAELATNSTTSVSPKPQTIPIEILAVQQDTDTNKIVKSKPEPPPAPRVPPRTTIPQETNNDVIAMGPTDVNVDVTMEAIPGPTFAGPTEGDAMPIVRVNPKFPIKAARDGIEGWVTLSFTIDEIGKVTDVQILDASPKRVFDQEAKKALKKWKYKPKVKDGKAIKQFDQTIMLEFNLDQS